jgi:hypothetical protein
MNTCDTCKHWAGPVEQYDEELDKFVAKCRHPKLSSEKDAIDGAQTFEGYGGIFTGPKFGCIFHEAKKEEGE